MRGAQKLQKTMLLKRFGVWKKVKAAPSNKTTKKSNKRAPRGLCQTLIHLVWASGPPWGALKVFDCRLRQLRLLHEPLLKCSIALLAAWTKA